MLRVCCFLLDVDLLFFAGDRFGFVVFCWKKGWALLFFAESKWLFFAGRGSDLLFLAGSRLGVIVSGWRYDGVCCFVLEVGVFFCWK